MKKLLHRSGSTASSNNTKEVHEERSLRSFRGGATKFVGSILSHAKVGALPHSNGLKQKNSSSSSVVSYDKDDALMMDDYYRDDKRPERDDDDDARRALERLERELQHERAETASLRDETAKLSELLESERRAGASLRAGVAAMGGGGGDGSKGDDAANLGLMNEIAHLSEIYCQSQAAMEEMKIELENAKASHRLANQASQSRLSALEDENRRLREQLERSHQSSRSGVPVTGGDDDAERVRSSEERAGELLDALAVANEEHAAALTRALEENQKLERRLANETAKNKLLVGDLSKAQTQYALLESHTARKRRTEFDETTERRLREEQKNHAVATAKRLLKDRKISQREYDQVIKAAEDAASTLTTY